VAVNYCVILNYPIFFIVCLDPLCWLLGWLVWFGWVVGPDSWSVGQLVERLIAIVSFDVLFE